MSVYQHFNDEICAIIDSVDGLAVVRLVPSNTENQARPWARVLFSGESQEPTSEARKLSAMTAIYIIEVNIESPSGDSIEEERNRLAEMINHAIDTQVPTSYDGDLYQADVMSFSYTGASGLMDDGQQRSQFYVTTELRYTKQPKG